MFRPLISGLAFAALLGAGASAEVFEVKMLNKNDEGRMVFEPAFVQVAPGDTVKFIVGDKGHNAEVISEMIPEGAEAFAGKINEEIEVTLDVEGLYAIKCKPHFAMGMVMTIAVGEAETPAGYLEGRLPKKALERFQAQLGNL